MSSGEVKTYLNCGTTRLQLEGRVVEPGDTVTAALPEAQEAFLTQIGALRPVPTEPELASDDEPIPALDGGDEL